MFSSLGRQALVLFAAASIALQGLPASAEELTADQENEAIVYAWDNAVFTLYHEIGHMLVDLYQIPVLAKEEDGVDNLATLMALDDYNRDGDPIITDAAYGWVAWMKNDDFSNMKAGDFFDEHSISTQRAFQMICVLVGSNKEEFGEIATRFGLSDERQDSCAGEYEQTKRSWDMVMAPHRKPNTSEPMVTIAYAEPGKDTVDARDILADNKVLETVAKLIDGLYTLPSPITLKAEDCGAVNAYYSSGNQTITLCYEIVEQYYDQYRSDIENGVDPTEVAVANPNAAASGEDGATDESATEESASDESAAEDGATEESAAEEDGSDSSAETEAASQ